jgi:hypothetical protein
VKERVNAQPTPGFTFAGNDIVSPIDRHKTTIQTPSSAIYVSSMTGLTKHTSSESSSAAIDPTTTQDNSRAIMSAPNTSQHSGPLVLGPIDTNTEGTFPGLIPGLAGGLPGQQSVNAHQQQKTPPSTAPSYESTDERLNRLETLAANQAQEIVSLRYIYSASCEESQGLRVRIADLEGRLNEGSPATRLSPVSIKYNYSATESATGHPKWETPAREKKRSRFATFFEQMAAAPTTGTPTLAANKNADATPISQDQRSQHAALLKIMATASAARKDSHSMEMATGPVLKSTPSTAFTAHYGQIITPPPSNHFYMDPYGEVDVDNDPYPWGGRFGQPDFDFAGLVPPTSTFTPAGPQYHEMDFYGWPSAPHGQEVDVENDPFPWGRRFPNQPDFDFAALVNPFAAGDAYGDGKEMQACGALHAPRPIHPMAPLLNRNDF